jgi:hypothetical protein
MPRVGRSSRLWILPVTFVWTSCSGPSSMPDAWSMPLDGGDADGHVQTDASNEVGPTDASPAFDGTVEDAGAPSDGSLDAATACESAGNVCITAMPGACAPPDVSFAMLACGSGEVCCMPATGSPAPCASSGGMCIVMTPVACPAPGRYGPPEIYLCPSGERCCLAGPPH